MGLQTRNTKNCEDQEAEEARREPLGAFGGAGRLHLELRL